MVKQKMKNPLHKRYLRELKSDFGKYLALFLLMLFVIALTSGYIIACGSMTAAYNESFEKYHVEYGNFTVQKKLNKSQIKAIKNLDVELCELFFSDLDMDNGKTIRVFKNRKDMNTVCIMKGKLPGADGEIAIDRMFADNNKLKIGDTLSGDGCEWKITGLISLPDYSALFADNNDSMFDAVQFSVAIITDSDFAAIPENAVTKRYAFRYQKLPSDDKEQKEMSDQFLKKLKENVHLEGYLPRYRNRAMTFTGEDLGSDKAMMEMLLYIVMAILAFVFAVTISNTIAKEANTIGTLRASGFTRGELIRHYMTMPLLVTLAAAIAGNVLGYTVLKGFVANLYYGSYSLPTYVTRWSGEAFWKTTLIPFAILLLIDYLVLRKRLSLSPLNFLRRDLRKKRKRGAVRLNKRIPFFTRFRIRVALQNIPNYVVLFIGIIFADVLLMFGLALPVLLDHYEETLPDQMMSEYQYILTIPEGALEGENKIDSMLHMLQFSRAVQTENPDAEKFMAYSLRIPPEGIYNGEDVMIYGVDPGSRYVNLNLKEGEVYISSAYADKFGLSAGDEFTLFEEYEDREYTFRVDGIYDYYGSIALFMPRADVNTLFDFDKDMFAGYFSDTPITDISEEYIGQVIDYDALTKISRQLDVSFGGMMGLVVGFAIIMFMIIIYVLSKIIIEKNAQSISMVKILGYQNGEISRLYVNSTSVVVVIMLLAAYPIVTVLLKWMYQSMLAERMAGWIPFYQGPLLFPEMIGLGLITYFAVSVFEYRKIKKVPMDEALKNVE